VIDRTGIRFSPFPTVIRADIPVRWIATMLPSNTTVPFTPFTVSGAALG
jgi:hypothetical protein